jgi:hypothetical protein
MQPPKVESRGHAPRDSTLPGSEIGFGSSSASRIGPTSRGGGGSSDLLHRRRRGERGGRIPVPRVRTGKGHLEVQKFLLFFRGEMVRVETQVPDTIALAGNPIRSWSMLHVSPFGRPGARTADCPCPDRRKYSGTAQQRPCPRLRAAGQRRIRSSRTYPWKMQPGAVGT